MAEGTKKENLLPITLFLCLKAKTHTFVVQNDYLKPSVISIEMRRTFYLVHPNLSLQDFCDKPDVFRFVLTDFSVNHFSARLLHQNWSLLQNCIHTVKHYAWSMYFVSARNRRQNLPHPTFKTRYKYFLIVRFSKTKSNKIYCIKVSGNLILFKNEIINLTTTGFWIVFIFSSTFWENKFISSSSLVSFSIDSRKFKSIRQRSITFFALAIKIIGKSF